MRNVLIVLLLVAIAVAAWFLLSRAPVEEAVPPPATELPDTVEPLAPAPAPAPLPGEEQDGEPAVPLEPALPPLPALADSDPAALESAGALTGASPYLRLLLTDNIISRIVATVDALTARQVPGKLLPFETPDLPFQAVADPAPPSPVTNAEGDMLAQYTLDAANYARYEPYIALLESVDTERLVAEYLRYEPLLQQAYVELGYPNGNFTQRLLEVIDHLLASPEAGGAAWLIKPEAYYEFVDPDLEALSAGQKLMIRMGSANAARVKGRLRDFRAALGG